MTILRSRPQDGAEIWCRCDAGPHGFLAIAAHAHADALSVEVRHDGTDLLADPGTYCYHGDPQWRSYFRSTRGHNTLELGEQNQSTAAGAFLWSHHAESRLLGLASEDDGSLVKWSGEHHGYEQLDPRAVHQRQVRLASETGQIEIVDRVHTSAPDHSVRLSLHLGPDVSVDLTGAIAELTWTSRDGETRTGTLRLPEQLEWTAARGSTDPILGWYSAQFGEKEPATTLVGWVGAVPDGELRTVLELPR